MLKGIPEILSPELLKVLCEMGHSDRIVIADERSPRDGRFIKEIGYYDPTQDPSVIKFDEEEAKKWLQNGVQPTPRVAKLLQLAGITK